MGGSGTPSLPLHRHYLHNTRSTRRGLLAACRAAFLTEVADVVGWDVQDARAPATGSTAEPHAPRLITGCWLRLAHQSLFTAAFGSASKQQCSPVRISFEPFGPSAQSKHCHSPQPN